MLGFYFSLPFLLFALYRLFVVLYNYFTRPYLPIGIPTDNPLVSIFIYVQNSEKSIGKLLTGLSNQTHQNYEVLIYNDQSTDKTVDLISEISGGDKRFRLFNGNDVNSGWQRKNYAYDKLVQLAKGQYYTFANSELIIDNQFVANALYHMHRKSLSLLTIYPKFQSQSFWKGLQNSAFQQMFFSLVLVKYYLRKRAGDRLVLEKQLIIIEANNYQTNRWFEKFKDIESPESKISDEICLLNFKSDSLLGDNSLTYEVTNSYNEITDYQIGLITRFNKSKKGLIAYAIAATLGLFIAIFLLPFPLVFLYLFAIICSRMLVAMLNQESVLISLLLLPVQFIVMTQILVKAIKKNRE